MTARDFQHQGQDKHVPARGDLPAYTLRVSSRAKRVRLRFTPREGLVVVVPRNMRGFDPSTILRDNFDWIDGAHARVAERRAALLAGADALLPDEVSFPATGENWGVDYRASGASTVRAETLDRLLVLRGATNDGDACLAALNRWLQRAARERLLALLAQESARTGIGYRRATVRGQRSRWGSCSSAGSISLNRCLVFLEPELARAVVLHELAHLRHANHSKAFWRELEKMDPDVAAHRTAMAQAWNAVPPWAEP